MQRFRAPSRKQLEDIVGTEDREMIHKLEQLFRQSGIDMPDEIDGLAIEAAVVRAGLKSMILSAASDIIGEIRTTPAHQCKTDSNNPQDLAPASRYQTIEADNIAPSPQRARQFRDLEGLNLEGLESGQALVYDDVTRTFTPLDGPDGAFETVDNLRVVVTKGLITSITPI